MSAHTIHLTVNGQLYEAVVNGSITLLQFLRETLHLTGTKDGCAEGDCGACTVMLNTHAVKSCLVLAAQVEGAEVVTVEGLAGPEGRLHPLQEAFMEVGAVQCGYCTPGMLLATKALLDVNPRPTQPEIRLALSGNLCRCTGYAKIFQAVELASARMAHLAPAQEVPKVASGVVVRPAHEEEERRHE
jgi:aerobic carbon-monoxide dehydrogenase small subunit